MGGPFLFEATICPDPPYYPVVSGVQPLAAADLVIGTGRLPKSDQPVVRATTSQNPERKRNTACLYLALLRGRFPQNIKRAVDCPCRTCRMSRGAGFNGSHGCGCASSLPRPAPR